ncbi:hypothetical protein [Bradyrhizobium sp. AUGA SZCCT0283]|uniref:hypothetical protein n=1 Tax=Bradyrhizobium sp. AUGA SZCCT0283 TaxID=2807671 RepID=UPI0020123F34|nr:hypothetical protein [Bradyrhizobium sp. AUGA SZCCT0283]
MNPDQENFNLDQGQISYQRVVLKTPAKPRSAVPSGVLFWRPMAWFKRFYDPIILPDGRKLLTYRDAAEYITALPKAERDAADWQVAMETLLLAAERDGPEMLARIAVKRALNRRAERPFPPPTKPAKA